MLPEARYIDGFPDGEALVYFQNGDIYSRQIFRNTGLTDIFVYDPSGKDISEETDGEAFSQAENFFIPDLLR